MEMPEGWVKLFKPNYADDDFKIAMQRCGDLMKEMAEALEDVLQKDQTKTNWKKAYRILEDFKEWE